MERVDVAVVGGGPAGTAAAWTAAEHGANAVVIEKGVPRADRDGPGPDSTDAAGLLDYWIDIMEFGTEEIPEDVRLRDLDGADFIGPSESFQIDQTGIDASYPAFGVAFHRAKFDDWLREEAEAAGASYRIGDSVTDVETTIDGTHEHRILLSSGEEITATYLILADGPQRTITTDVLDQFTGDRKIADVLNPTKVNHIAYQEHRRVPEELYDPARLKFWWGIMPGHTAYPWVFPNDENIARIGLTMPIGLDIGDYNPDHWELLRRDDEQIPQGKVYIRRLLEREYPDYELDDFPLVEDRGKRGGTETYPISSTRPIESPTAAGIAVVGGAMGGTSAFHEGGDHVAVRTGKIAGRLAAQEHLEQYNSEWRDALDTEFLRNVTMAELVQDYQPSDWDRTFGAARTMFNRGEYSIGSTARAGLTGLKMLYGYKRTKSRFKNGNYIQFRESEYSV
ncbi:NAD(P)/FAD-dependent oxidoreductase [Halobacteriaceae archaeon SHR40]|uniref:NAD(P)/FAD-dependent oxidoreductase n=1 Tax=Halovenus amylolytica TaxID=2500550 RepID=UPI000FE38660